MAANIMQSALSMAILVVLLVKVKRQVECSDEVETGQGRVRNGDGETVGRGGFRSNGAH